MWATQLHSKPRACRRRRGSAPGNAACCKGGMDVALIDGVVVALASTLAISLRPWRTVDPAGPPWEWVIAWATLPLLWSLDRQLGVSLLPPLSGAALLVLLTGWPLAVLACVPMALLAA